MQSVRQHAKTTHMSYRDKLVIWNLEGTKLEGYIATAPDGQHWFWQEAGRSDFFFHQLATADVEKLIRCVSRHLQTTTSEYHHGCYESALQALIEVFDSRAQETDP